MKQKIFLILNLTLILLISVLIFSNMKFGAYTGISSSYMEISQNIEANNDIYSIINKKSYMDEDYKYYSHLPPEDIFPFLPDNKSNLVVPSGYFLIDKNGYVGTKYPFYFSYTASYFKIITNLELFYFIPFISVLFILLFYIICRNIFDEMYAFIAILILVSFPTITSLMTGRFIRELFSLVIIFFAFYLLYQFSQKNDWRYFYASLFVSGLACSIRITNVIAVIPFSLLILDRFIDIKTFFRDFKKYLTGLFLFIIGFIPFLFQFLYPYFLLDRFFLPISGNINALKLHNFYTGSVISQEIPNLFIFLKQSIEPIGLIIFIPILIYIYFKFPKDKNKFLFLSILSFYFTFIFFFSMWANSWPRYIVNSIPILAIIVVYSIYSFKLKPIYVIFIALFIIPISIISLNYTIFEKTHYYSEVYDYEFFEEIKNVDYFIDKNSLILYHSNVISVLGNQNLRGYMDSVIHNADIVGITQIDFNETICPHNIKEYSNFYLITSDFLYERDKYDFQGYIDLKHEILNVSYNFYYINMSVCEK